MKELGLRNRGLFRADTSQPKESIARAALSRQMLLQLRGVPMGSRRLLSGSTFESKRLGIVLPSWLFAAPC